MIATSHLIDEHDITQVTDYEDQPFVNLTDTFEENRSEINYENIAKNLGLNLDHSELSEEQNVIIRESNSPRHSPVVLVKKPNGEYRFAIDYRELNKVTEPISFPIPTLNEVFDTLADSRAQIFSLCDLRSGFHQIPLCPSTAEKASFITHQGVFTPTRLPFGLMNSPMCSQNLMSKCLKDLNWKIALVYIDDILIFSKNFDQHLEHFKI